MQERKSEVPGVGEGGHQQRKCLPARIAHRAPGRQNYARQEDPHLDLTKRRSAPGSSPPPPPRTASRNRSSRPHAFPLFTRSPRIRRDLFSSKWHLHIRNVRMTGLAQRTMRPARSPAPLASRVGPDVGGRKRSAASCTHYTITLSAVFNIVE